MLHRITAPALASACCAALAIAGCGGSDSKDTAKATPTPNGSGSGTATPDNRAPAPGPLKVTQGVRVLKPGAKAQDKFTSRASVKVGDIVQVQTVVNRAPKSAPKFEIVLQKGPATTLDAEAGARGAKPSGTATIRSESGDEIGLATPRYTCVIGVTAFCNKETARDSSKGFSLRIDALAPRQPVVVTATVVSATGSPGQGQS